MKKKKLNGPTVSTDFSKKVKVCRFLAVYRRMAGWMGYQGLKTSDEGIMVRG